MWIDVSLQNGNEATMGTEEHQKETGCLFHVQSQVHPVSQTLHKARTHHTQATIQNVLKRFLYQPQTLYVNAIKKSLSELSKHKVYLHTKQDVIISINNDKSVGM